MKLKSGKHSTCFTLTAKKASKKEDDYPKAIVLKIPDQMKLVKHLENSGLGVFVIM